MQKKEIVLYQRDIRQVLPKYTDSEYLFILNDLAKGQCYILPEYFAFHKDLSSQQDFIEYSKFAYTWLKQLSLQKEAQQTVIIGGSILSERKKKIYNESFVFYEGKEIASYKKRILFGHEVHVLHKGRKKLFFKHPIQADSWGILICADVFLRNIFKKHKKANYIALPTASPLKDESDEIRNNRDQEIYITGAKKSGSILFKCCSVGQVGGTQSNGEHPPKIQGRSLIANSEKILLKAPHIYWTGSLHFHTQTQEVYLREFEKEPLCLKK